MWDSSDKREAFLLEFLLVIRRVHEETLTEARLQAERVARRELLDREAREEASRVQAARVEAEVKLKERELIIWLTTIWKPKAPVKAKVEAAVGKKGKGRETERNTSVVPATAVGHVFNDPPPVIVPRVKTKPPVRKKKEEEKLRVTSASSPRGGAPASSGNPLYARKSVGVEVPKVCFIHGLVMCPPRSRGDYCSRMVNPK